MARRRKLAYGWNYEPSDRRLAPAPPFPDYLYPLRDRCARALDINPETLVQATLTYYPPGAGLDSTKMLRILGAGLSGCPWDQRRGWFSGMDRKSTPWTWIPALYWPFAGRHGSYGPMNWYRCRPIDTLSISVPSVDPPIRRGIG